MMKIIPGSVVAIVLMCSQAFSQAGVSLYSDIKAHRVGEVVTVLVVENATAKQQSTDKSKSNAAVNADGSLSGTFANFLPVFGASSVISSDVDNSNGSTQEDRLSAKITATIVERTEAGLLRISGERSVEVNGEENIMRLSGVVRPRDIRTNNTIYSYNIADAQIVYRQAGAMHSMASPTKISKVVAVSVILTLIGFSIAGVGL